MKRFQNSPGINIAALLGLLAVTAAMSAELERSADYDYDAPTPGSYMLPVIKPAADGALLDSDGQLVRLRNLTRGRITVLSFIYTRCSDVKACPYATGVLNQIHELSGQDKSLAGSLRLVSLSFDPEVDTPERMAAYSQWARERKNVAEWRFVTAKSRTQMQPVLDAYGQVVDKKRNPNDPTGPLNHSLRVFLIDRDSRIRNIYSSGTLDVRLVLADVRTLMMEAGVGGTGVGGTGGSPVNSSNGGTGSLPVSASGGSPLAVPRTPACAWDLIGGPPMPPLTTPPRPMATVEKTRRLAKV